MLHLGAGIAHDGLQVHVQLTQRTHQAADVVVARHVQLLGQVARRHAVGELHQVLQRRNRHAPQLPSAQQAQHQGQTGLAHRHPGSGEMLSYQYAAPNGQRRNDEGHQHQLATDADGQRALEAAAPGIDHQTAGVESVHLSARLLFGPHLGVKVLGGVHLLARGHGADRHVTPRAVAVHQRRHVGHHPVVGAVLAPVLHRGGPGVALADGVPHVPVRLLGHVRVADQVVRLPQQFFLGEPADRYERRVAIQDPTLQVCRRDEGLARRKGKFLVDDRQVQAHDWLLWLRSLQRVIPLATSDVFCSIQDRTGRLLEFLVV